MGFRPATAVIISICFTRNIINIVEDSAIEHEVIHGVNISDTVETRVELTRRIHSQTPDNPEDVQQPR